MNQTPAKQLKTKSRKTNKSTVSAFISKTFEILEDAKHTDIIDWNPEGTTIIIYKPVEFANQVLSTYFKHKNLTSFVRQLNMYNFHKQRTHKIEHIYHHELFQRGKRYLLDQIKRKSQEQVSIEQPEDALSPSEPFTPDTEMTKIIQEKQALKRYNLQASERITCLEGKVKDLSVQNRGLRAKIYQQDERDKLVISIMGSLLEKYGIPPTELACILTHMPNSFNGENGDLNDCQAPLQAESMSDVQTGVSEAEFDVSNFLNFGEDNTNQEVMPLTNRVGFNDDFFSRGAMNCNNMNYVGQNNSTLMKRSLSDGNNLNVNTETYEPFTKKFEVKPFVEQSWERFIL